MVLPPIQMNKTAFLLIMLATIASVVHAIPADRTSPTDCTECESLPVVCDINWHVVTNSPTCNRCCPN
jgi:hypothetical protein